jgi:hypothetical protein
VRASIAIVAIGLIVTCPDVSACDADSDCGVGGICIKREKRARGVCYKDKAKRQQLMEFMGDPEQLIKEQLPGRKIRGNCTVTTDCPTGYDCVHAYFEGRCVEF